MSVKKSVFASKSDRENFTKLSREWAKKYNIYHNLPFLNVFDTSLLFDFSDWDKLKQIQLSELEFSRLKKTSIDYTLCDFNDKPILCIEFDGLKQGINVGTTYHPKCQGDNWRKEITELKLKVAHGSLFPFFVVGSDYFNDLSDRTRLTIVDGIIGEVLGNQAARERISQGFDPIDVGWTNEDFERLSENEKSDIIQGWVTDIEAISDMENNPVTRRSAELDEEVSKISYSIEHLTSPDIYDISDIAERFRFYEQVKLFGTRITIQTQDLGDVKATVWLPNFKTPGFSGGFLSIEIAKLVALEKLKKLRESKS